MSDLSTYTTFDGRTLAYQAIGEGRTTLMLHGFLASAKANFIAPGIAAAIAARGRRLVLPDFRGHGANAGVTGADAYPPDVLALDQEALLAHLNVTDYDLVGYSLGARISVRMLARGARPGKVVLGGMGDTGITDVAVRQAHFERLIRGPETPQIASAMRVVASMMAHAGLTADSALAVLASQLSTPPELLAQMRMPVLVISGRDDADNGSAEGLAALLAHARAVRTPGNHLSAVATPELAAEVAAFLG